MKLPKSLVMNKKMITKLQETQLSNILGGSGNAVSCKANTCNTSCHKHTCGGGDDENALTAE